MNVSSEGRDEVGSTTAGTGASPGKAPLVGVAGGDGRAAAGGAPHWMTEMAMLARWAGRCASDAPSVLLLDAVDLSQEADSLIMDLSTR